MYAPHSPPPPPLCWQIPNRLSPIIVKLSIKFEHDLQLYTVDAESQEEDKGDGVEGGGDKSERRIWGAGGRGGGKRNEFCY